MWTLFQCVIVDGDKTVFMAEKCSRPTKADMICIRICFTASIHAQNPTCTSHWRSKKYTTQQELDYTPCAQTASTGIWGTLVSSVSITIQDYKVALVIFGSLGCKILLQTFAVGSIVECNCLHPMHIDLQNTRFFPCMAILSIFVDRTCYYCVSWFITNPGLVACISFTIS